MPAIISDNITKLSRWLRVPLGCPPTGPGPPLFTDFVPAVTIEKYY